MTEPIIVVLVTIDRDATVLTKQDGQQATFPHERPLFGPTSLLARLDWAPSMPGLLATTVHGDSIVFEIPSAATTGPDDRPSVYLDQVHWSTFQKVIDRRGSVNEADAAAAERLAAWAADRRIVLPASAGNYHETTKWLNTQARYTLGLRILQVSRGWQLRDPLAVRRDELRQAFLRTVGDDPAPAPAVVTLEPHAVLSGRDIPPLEVPLDFSVERARLHAALTHATTMIDVMLDREPLEGVPPTGWASAQQDFSDWLRDEDRDSTQKRASIDVMFLNDLRPELAEEALRAGLTPESFSAWLHGDWAAEVQDLPALGLYRELFQQRHLAASTWEPNDLSDMVYLACGAAYTDYAVCERHMTSFLRQSLRRLGRPVNVYPRLRDVIEPLQARLGAES